MKQGYINSTVSDCNELMDRSAFVISSEYSQKTQEQSTDNIGPSTDHTSISDQNFSIRREEWFITEHIGSAKIQDGEFSQGFSFTDESRDPPALSPNSRPSFHWLLQSSLSPLEDEIDGSVHTNTIVIIHPRDNIM